MRKVTEITHKDTTRTFLFPTEDMCLHIIKTGFSQSKRYLVVYEDAYQQDLGKTELLSSKEIKEKFQIQL
jgi:hypothetical protein